MAVLTLLAAITGLTLVMTRHSRASEVDPDHHKAPLHLSVDESPIARENRGLASFSPVVKRVAPCVVTVTTTSKPKRQQMPDIFSEDPFFRRFFGNGQGMEPRQEKQYGLGSGVIVTKDGYILTNNHVVDGADSIKVVLKDGREFKAKVVGTDPQSDVAVLKIKADDLPFMTVADSDKIETGDIVLAIGNPFGIGQTVTMGMVSATGRTRVLDGTGYQDFIQTDAAINPGNSGGALVDVDGRLVGINTAILSRSGGNQGIGFAIPSDLARRVMVSLVRDGRVVRGYLGVHIQNVDANLASEFKLPDAHGALVTDVKAGTPGDKAGLKSGDVIVKFNGKQVSDSSHLRLEVADTAPGTKVPVELVREGKAKTLDVVVQELPGEKMAKDDSEDAASGDTLNGVAVSDLSSRTRREAEIPSQIQGVLVTQIDQNSAAYEAGLRTGDVILEINHKAVHSAEEAVSMTSNVKDRHTLLRVWQRDPQSGESGTRFIVVDETKNN
jgi:serine protease Do